MSLINEGPVELNTTLLSGPPDSETPTVASDMEGTLSAGATWQGLRDYLKQQGRQSAYMRFLLPRLVQIPLYRFGLVDKQAFRENWVRGILALFKGMSRQEFDRVAEWVVENHLWPQRRRQVIQALQAHQEAGRRVIIVSGVIEPVLRIFADKLGVEGIGTPLAYQNDVMMGDVSRPFTTGPRKVQQLRPFLPPDGRLYAGYGDTMADVPMLTLCEQAAVVAPDDRLRQEAEERGWRIFEDQSDET